MWTPRRLLLVVIGLVLFSGGFTVYSRLFGWIDGLPPLPERYTAAPDGSHELQDYARKPPSPLTARLRHAFGPNCVEETYNLKFESREKGLLFAAAESKILEDGRVRLLQVSVAVFAKSSKDMTTVHADRAILTFDQPVRKIDDMGTRKVREAELHADPEYPTSDPRKGKIHIISNRKTVDPEDDLIVRTPGPLYYVDEPKPGQPHIWTLQSVEMTDLQNRPLPSQAESQLQQPTITGEGMRAYLIAAAPTPQANPKKKASTSSINGVDHIELDHNVFMNLWTESQGMLGGAPRLRKQPMRLRSKRCW